jgi:hypothetical protein
MEYAQSSAEIGLSWPFRGSGRTLDLIADLARKGS